MNSGLFYKKCIHIIFICEKKLPVKFSQNFRCTYGILRNCSTKLFYIRKMDDKPFWSTQEAGPPYCIKKLFRFVHFFSDVQIVPFTLMFFSLMVFPRQWPISRQKNQIQLNHKCFKQFPQFCWNYSNPLYLAEQNAQLLLNYP